MLDLADFILQEQPDDNLMFAISRAWYNGSYTMATKAQFRRQTFHELNLIQIKAGLNHENPAF